MLTDVRSLPLPRDVRIINFVSHSQIRRWSEILLIFSETSPTQCGSTGWQGEALDKEKRTVNIGVQLCLILNPSHESVRL